VIIAVVVDLVDWFYSVQSRIDGLTDVQSSRGSDAQKEKK
jgi:hypothetical protein